MIIEHVHLQIKPDQSVAFERAMDQAKSIVATMPGFQSLQLMQQLHQADRYILMISWDKIEHHTEGFRKSAAYLEWKALLHHFYDPMPTVEYYAPCISLDSGAD